MHFSGVLENLTFWPQLAVWFAILVVVSIIIAKACDYFEGAADFLGRHLPPGVKGATVNAAGSSMPELLSAVALLFFVQSYDSLGAGIALTAGSAVFNTVFIPLCVVIAIMGTFRLGAIGWAARKSEIEISKTSLIRDGIALISAEIVLITLLSQKVLTWVDGAILVAIYIPYVAYMWWQSRGHRNENVDEENQRHTTSSAWGVLAVSVAVLVVACYALAESVIGTAQLFDVNDFVTAIFLGAAASSVPDTILSIKDARKGKEDDAISNAVGSNTFDICIALGLPLLAYSLINGPVEMPSHEGIQTLRIGLVLITLTVFAIFLIPKRIKLWHAFVLAGLYAGWVFFALNAEFAWI